jgi:hypothetical protein
MVKTELRMFSVYSLHASCKTQTVQRIYVPPPQYCTCFVSVTSGEIDKSSNSSPERLNRKRLRGFPTGQGS